VTRRVEKPWGYEIIYAANPKYAGKILVLRAGERLSLQYHVKKEETIYLLSGELELSVEEGGALVTRRLRPGEAYHIAPGIRHRMIGVTDCQIAEVSTPELDDVVRLEDAYGRANTEKAGTVLL
jgi:quercetin dioxygenase-like cupin family protein